MQAIVFKLDLAQHPAYNIKQHGKHTMILSSLEDVGLIDLSVTISTALLPTWILNFSNNNWQN